MRIAIEATLGCPVEGTDGNVGTLRDMFFESETWHVRYLVVDTGGWLSRSRVLLSPVAVERLDWEREGIRVGLSRSQVEACPDVDMHQPVSRQKELELIHHFGWQPYWAMSPVGTPGEAVVPTESVPLETGSDEDSVLQSAHDVTRCYVHAQDGIVGHIQDLILDDEAWVVRYLVVDTQTWLPGRRVLISPDWVDAFDWEQREARVGLARQSIEESPPFDPATPVNRDYEGRLHDYYGRSKYWE